GADRVALAGELFFFGEEALARGEPVTSRYDSGEFSFCFYSFGLRIHFLSPSDSVFGSLFAGPVLLRRILAVSAVSPPVAVTLPAISVRVVVMHTGHIGSSQSMKPGRLVLRSVIRRARRARSTTREK